MNSAAVAPCHDEAAQNRAAGGWPALCGTPVLRVAQHPQFVTADPTECRDYIWRATGTHRWAIERASRLVRFSHYEQQLGRMSLNVTDSICTSGFQVRKDGSASTYSFQFLVEGRCELEGPFGRFIVEPGEAFILGPDQVTREVWGERCVQYIVRVDRQFVEQMIATELQHELRAPLVFRPVSRDTGISAWLHQILSTPVLAPVDSEASRSVLCDRRVVRSIERTLVLMFLTSFEHTETQALNRPRLGSAPFYIRRAEEYIRANAREELTVESIAAAARVSARSIFYGFKRWRDTTPMAHVRKVRLDLAREALLRAGREGGTVSQAAVAVGFTNFSQFSKVYKARYGETPSATLRQA